MDCQARGTNVRFIHHRETLCASGFIWQIGEYGLGDTVEAVKRALKHRRYVMTDYGEKWSIDHFWEMFNDIIEEKVEEREFS